MNFAELSKAHDVRCDDRTEIWRNTLQHPCHAAVAAMKQGIERNLVATLWVPREAGRAWNAQRDRLGSGCHR